MTDKIRIKKIQYLLPPKDILEDSLDVFVELEDNYCTDGFCYWIEITTPQFLSTLIKKENNASLSPEYPSILVSELTNNTIRAAIESFVNSDDQAHWLKLYHIMPQLSIEEINEILLRKKQEKIELNAEVEAEFEEEIG